MTDYTDLIARLRAMGDARADISPAWQRAIDQAAEALAALIAGVKVKPLEWELRANKEGVVYCAYDPLYGREVEAPNERTCDAIDQDRTARILAALEAAPHVNETPKSEHDGADMLTNAAQARAVTTEALAALQEALHEANAYIADLTAENQSHFERIAASGACTTNGQGCWTRLDRYPICSKGR